MPPPDVLLAPTVRQLVLFHASDGCYRPAIVLAEPGSDPENDRAVEGTGNTLLAVFHARPARLEVVHASEGHSVLQWHEPGEHDDEVGLPPNPGGNADEAGADKEPPPVDENAVALSALDRQEVALAKRLEGAAGDKLAPALRAKIVARIHAIRETREGLREDATTTDLTR